MKRVFHWLQRSRFARNVAVVAGGTATAQVIGIIFTPFVTRIYGPEAFGLVGVFLALVGVVSPLAALSYPIAIVLPREDADAKALVRLSLMIAGALSLTLFLAIAFARGPIARAAGAEGLGALLLLVPVVVFLSVLSSVLRQWLIRKKRFGVTARVHVAHSALLHCAKIGVGLFHATGGVLIGLAVAGTAFHAALLRRGVRSTSGWNEPVPAQAKLRQVAIAHRDFPIFRCPQVFINSISQNLPVLMLATFFGPAAAGFYALGRRIVGVPIQLIGESVGQVFYPRIVEAVNVGQSPFRLLAKATGALAVVGAPIFGAIIVFGPFVFALAFGSEWERAGKYAQWLALWMYFGFLNRPSVATVPSLGLQRGLLIYEVFSTGTKLMALYLGFFIFKDDLVAVAAFGVVGALAYALLILWVGFEAVRFKSSPTISNETTTQKTS